ncbi:gamma-glutamyltransferase [Pseudomarimonas arenosa]|uniref:Glutathione hydrolase proenzyme n=1 Tax=Pseudomarimonas arenosa TaxID=2774145 RepID=A0AAW3ZNC3_9GAMM|nr:gamma-glutamyltransferase [Pseudomarimonas arenosa]MBD8526577.1 gamma-glutamyltransferase [Pseudomarimonas arenosa]
MLASVLRWISVLWLVSSSAWAEGDAGLRDGRDVLPKQVAVATANAQATDAGLEILAQGGNAFDAAVAISATLGLVEPESSGLGGGGFMLLHVAADGRNVFIDARERAPLAASRDMYLNASGAADRDKAVNGALAAAIPGLPAGLVQLSRYGRLPLSKSLAPAIRLARQGWRFSAKNASMMGWRKELLAQDPGAREMFVRKGQLPEVGQVLKNPDYAAVLVKLAEQGHDGYYRGELAQRLVDGVRNLGGIWSLEDLARYHVVERDVLSFRYRGFQIITAPPPSSGGVALAQSLQILAGFDLPSLATVDRVHLLTESMRRAYRDRAVYLGDPDFVQVPTALLASPEYAAGLRAAIHPEKATPSAWLPGVTPLGEREETTHFSVIDREGNLVAVTQTVNLPYGNAVSVPGTGFLLNNEMDDFSVKPGVPNAFGLVGDDANAIAPGKRPLSSMTPTFLIGRDRVAVLGTPGGSRIISMVLQGVLSLVEGQSPEQAVSRPRVHHQYLPDELYFEPNALEPSVQEALQARGHLLKQLDSSWGNMQAVSWDRRTGEVQAGSDPRWKSVGKGGVGEGRQGDQAVFR